MSIINLLPDEYIEQRSRRRANVLCFILFVAVMAGVLGAAVVSEEYKHNTLVIRDDVNESYAEAARLIEQVQQLDMQKRGMLQKAESTAALMERVPRSCLLAVVTNCMPENCALQSVTMTMKQVVAKEDTRRPATPVPAGGLPPAPKTNATMIIEVFGMAATDVEVARLIANLARNPLISSVDLVFSQEKLVDKVSLREFMVKIELRRDADAAALSAGSLPGRNIVAPAAAVPVNMEVKPS